MPSPDALSDILETFRSEGAALLKKIGDHLLSIEQTADPAAITAALETARVAAHTLKGGALMLNLLPIERLARAVEDLLVAMREGRVKPIPEVTELLLNTIDRVAELVRSSNLESHELSDEDNTRMSRLQEIIVAE